MGRKSKPIVLEKQESGCVVCSSHARNKDGYTIIGKARLPRRIWEEHNGPIPAGLYVLHRCDNPACVNPDHLFLGTQQDNMADRDAKDRQARGARSGMSKLTARDVQLVRLMRGRGDTQQQIGDCFGVSRQAIEQIIHGKTWKHDTPVLKSVVNKERELLYAD